MFLFKNWLLFFVVSLRYEWKNRRVHCIAGYENVHVGFFIHTQGNEKKQSILII